jgi:chromosome segregation ATPase
VDNPLHNESMDWGSKPVALSLGRIGAHLFTLAKVEHQIRQRSQACRDLQPTQERQRRLLLAREAQLARRESALAGTVAELRSREAAQKRVWNQVKSDIHRLKQQRQEWLSRLGELEHCESILCTLDARFERLSIK